VWSLLPLLMISSAGQTQIRLAYDSSDTGCPARTRLVGAVTARLGYDPFSDEAVDTVTVQLSRASNGLRATVIRLSGETEAGRRELNSPTGDCSELFRALELAVSLAIDPRAGLIRAPPQPPPAPAPVPATLPVAAVLPAAPKPRTPTIWAVALSPTGSVGTGPTPTFGFALVGAMRHGFFELNIGVRAEFSSILSLSPGLVRTQVIVGQLGTCLAIAVVRACVQGEGGALRVTSAGLSPPAQETVGIANLGLRFGLHLQLSTHFALRPFVDITASLARTVVLASGKEVWATSPVNGTLGLALAFTST
jgi:hypothetical protein